MCRHFLLTSQAWSKYLCSDYADRESPMHRLPTLTTGEQQFFCSLPVANLSHLLTPILSFGRGPLRWVAAGFSSPSLRLPEAKPVNREQHIHGTSSYLFHLVHAVKKVRKVTCPERAHKNPCFKIWLVEFSALGNGKKERLLCAHSPCELKGTEKQSRMNQAATDEP